MFSPDVSAAVSPLARPGGRWYVSRMRIVAVVVAGVVLLAAAHPAGAAEAKRRRSEKCLEICNFTFEQCQKELGPKGHGRCSSDAVRCKNACPFETIEEPAVPTAASHQRCIDVCRDTYQKCLRRPENKNGGRCAADDVRCEQACPKPAELAAATGAPGSGVPGAAAPAKKPKRGLRIEGSAAPAPLEPAPVAAPPGERPLPAAEGPAGSVPAHAEAVAPAAKAPADAASAAAAPGVAPAAPTAAAAAAAARPASEERGFWGTLRCFFVACEKPGTTPCLQQCEAAYDQCRVRESKRGGECNTRLMRCRKECSAATR